MRSSLLAALQPSALRADAQEAICAAGELFLAAHKGFQRPALLPACAREEGMSASELLFDKLPGTDSSADEVGAWQVSYQSHLLTVSAYQVTPSHLYQNWNA